MYIYSNDGQTELAYMYADPTINTVKLVSDGVMSYVSKEDPVYEYTYSGLNTFLGLATSPNATIPDYSAPSQSGWANGVEISKVGTYYIVEEVAPKKYLNDTGLNELVTKIKQLIATKQNTLVSGTNIKTINNTSILGSGNISVSGGTPTDVQINGTSITSNNVANIITNTAYNSSTNKIATMSDVPDVSGKQNTLQAKGSTTKPIYVSSAGTISETNTYAGGTAVTLNGTSKAATTASFYAPTTAISTSTSKSYLVGSSSTTSVATEYTNSSCYMQSGKLYSNGKEVVTLSDSQALTNKTYNGYTLGAACAKGTTTSVTSGSSDLITSGAVASAVDSLRKRFNTLSVTVTQNPGANTAYQATALTCVIIWMDADVSGSLNNSSGINFWTSPDGSTWTQVARFSSTSGYPKFGNICCVVPKGSYFRTNYWGMGSNNLVKMTRIVLDNYSA